MYFDSHTHYDDERFDEDRYILLESLKEKGVDYVVHAGADISSSHKGLELAKQYDFIYTSIGVHPHEVHQMSDGDIDKLRELAKEPKVVAIGEIGLDYYYNYSSKEDQVYWFKRQLELAKELSLPVIIHSREASQLTFDILKEADIHKGVIHCFSGSHELAKEYVKRGFYIGIGGAITFNNARKTIEVAEHIPIENIVIETDCPYLTPVPFRGKRNDSSYLKYVVEKIAQIKDMEPTEVARRTLENAKLLYGIR